MAAVREVARSIASLAVEQGEGGGMNELRIRLTDGTYQVVAHLADRMQLPMAGVVADALSLYWWLARERMAGTRLLVQRGSEVNELLVPSLERLQSQPESARDAVSAEILLPAADLQA